jgi:hypothetical protein
MVRGTTFAYPCSVRKADSDGGIVVCMEGRDIPSPCVSSLWKGNGRRLKPGRPPGEIHGAVPSRPSPASGKLRHDKAEWLAAWRNTSEGTTHHNGCLPQRLRYLRAYFQEWAYVGWRSTDESYRGLKHHIYSSLKEGLHATRPHAAVRIHQKHPI